MVGITLTIDIEDAQLQKALGHLRAQLSDMRPFYKSVGEQFLNSIAERFEDETKPDGSRWKEHAPATVAKRLAREGNAPLTILRQSGRLAGSFNYRASSDAVQVGTPVVYAAIHHKGGKAGRGKKVTIPARPILGISRADERAIADIAEAFLTH